MIRFALIQILPLVVILNSQFTITDAAEQGQKPQRREYFQIRMGIPIRILVYENNEALANNANAEAYKRIKELDRLLSDYDPDSELNQLCRVWEPGKFWPVSPELHQLLKTSQKISVESEGAFDVTVGPVVRLWRKSRRKKELPGKEQLQIALGSVGFQHVEIDSKESRVKLLRPRMQLDLGGIAKGYAAEEAKRILAKHGVTRVLIDAGGDIVVGDPPPDRNYWKIAVASLHEADPKKSTKLENNSQQYVNLRNGAIATSGDAYQYTEIDGKRYSHIVNPHTGIGLTSRSSVTVIAPTGTIADAYASTVSVLGPEAGIDFIEHHPGTATLILTEKKSRASNSWKKYLTADSAE